MNTLGSRHLAEQGPSLIDSRLRQNVSTLGSLLGQTIESALGEELLRKVESIRQIAKRARSGDNDAQDALVDALRNLQEEELLPVARAFNQFLNLANIAEQHHQVRRHGKDEAPGFANTCLKQLIARLRSQGMQAGEIYQRISELRLDLVLTAHPTEVMRRTLIQKYDAIATMLECMERTDPGSEERQEITDKLAALIEEIWYTDEIRQNRPTPIDEAKWGFALVENSLWEALPKLLRSIDKDLAEVLEEPFPPVSALIRFSSWMGGDRDGNPNVTANVTERVLLLGRWMAADLYLRDIEALISQLSMSKASDELLMASGTANEPYRALLKKLRTRLVATRQWAHAALNGVAETTVEVISRSDEILEPLQLCFRSLCSVGIERIAHGDLLDAIRRVQAFGPNLMRLDVRQDSGRHAHVLTELTTHLELDAYESWSEVQRQKFLLEKLDDPGFSLPPQWHPSPEAAEVIACCKIIASQPSEMIGSYVISMAHNVSDVLSVQLLLKLAGLRTSIPITPLFETLDDLRNAAECIDELLAQEPYKRNAGNLQEVMIGYSDSAKDAGTLAAAWAQYQAQEQLVKVCQRHGMKLRLFHGRGGTIGRGGAPAHQAILSQPPGSVGGELRVTEQGEMIRFKFGRHNLATQSLRLYLSAVLEATLLPPPEPAASWRNAMHRLSQDSVESYRTVVRNTPSFIDYFRQATPEQELARLPLGSRPPKRKGSGGIESLRAISWIFAWTQNRLLLPAWLGLGTALANCMRSEQGTLLEEMMRDWPFFRTRVDMLEMVLSKTDFSIARFYEQTLVADELYPLGQGLRAHLLQTIDVLLSLKQQSQLLEQNLELQASMNLRNPYTDPLHLLQAELLRRSRLVDTRLASPPCVEQALMVTFAGVAAGMRNTG